MRTPRHVRSAHTLAGLLLAAALALTGCSAGGDSGDSRAADNDEAAAQSDAKAAPSKGTGSGGGSESGASGAQAAESHIIRTASLTVQVKDVPRALDEARTAAEDAGGYVGDEKTTRDAGGHERTRVVLRVPVERYDEVLTDLQGAGRLIEREAKAEDVTEQVVDVQSRITSQRASVARVRELMDQATRLSDVVTLEGELSQRQSDLEALLARQASLKDRTSLATITLSLTETPVKKAAPKDEDPGFVDAVSGGWDAFVAMVRWISLVIGALLPFLVVAALLLLAWLRLPRPRLPRRPAPASPATTAGPLPAEPTRPGEGESESEGGGER